MHKNILSVIGITILFLGTCITPSVANDNVKKSFEPILSGNTLYVGGSGPGNYTSIQDAIDDAVDGDTVFVYNGIYYENVIIDTSISLVGENKFNTIIDGNRSGDVIQINITSVKVDNFTVQRSEYGLSWKWGIKTKGHISNIYVSNCIVESNVCGIWFNHISDSSITHCSVHHNREYSIMVVGSSKNIIINNCTIYNNGDDHGGGVIDPGSVRIDGEDEWSSNISISDCYIHDIVGRGIHIHWARNVKIYDNNLSRNTWGGIYMSDAHYINIFNNEFYRNIRFLGITVSGSSDIMIYYNVFSNNGDGDTMWSNGGVSCGDVNRVTIKNNKFLSNNRMGISIGRASGTIIIENEFINNIKYGLFISNSTNCNISDNIIKNSISGIHLTGLSANTVVSGNIISNNEQGLNIWSCNNVISNNNIHDNDEGIFLGYTSDGNTISCNNFLENKKHANFELLFLDFLHNIWYKNYWDRVRLFPYLIFGNIKMEPISIPWINFDWHPALKPYDI